MPTGRTLKQVETGILSPGIAANLIGQSPNSIRRWLDKGTLERIRFGRIDAGESRISALELLLISVKNCHPFKRELAVAAVNYARAFQYTYLAYAQEILRTYGQVSLTERKAIPIVPNPPETVEWDDKGNILPPLNPTATKDL
jgi:hypothetical protein